VLAVTVLSQAAGFVALLVALGVRGGLDGRSFALGVIGGVGGGIGLAAFYKALSLGTMSVVSPVAACSAVVPFVISLATGERPGARLAGSTPMARSTSAQRPPPSRNRAISSGSSATCTEVG
jgi:uncharacterized membrane protein